MTTLLDEALRALRKCADDLSAELAARYPPGARIYPSEEARFNRDMASVIKAREVLARADAQKDAPRSKSQMKRIAAQKDEAQGVTDEMDEMVEVALDAYYDGYPWHEQDEIGSPKTFKDDMRRALEAVAPMLSPVRDMCWRIALGRWCAMYTTIEPDDITTIERDAKSLANSGNGVSL